jgi:hypothetical protein
MANVVIRHCRVRVVRHGGWSWGASPKDLLAGVLEALPKLIAAKLAELFPEDAEVHIREPISLRIPLSLAELAKASAAAYAQTPKPAGALAAALERRLEEAFEDWVEVSSGRDAQTPAPVYDLPESEGERHFEAWLLEASRDGTLAAILERLPEQILRSWHDAIFSGQPPSGLTLEAIRAALPADIAALVERAPPRPRKFASESGRLAAEIALAAAIAAETRRTPRHAGVVGAVCWWRSISSGADGAISEITSAGEAVLEHPAPAEPPASTSAIVPASRPALVAPAAMPDDVRFSSVLPWLALPSLHRAGLLQAVAAVFEASRAEKYLPLFAAAFCAKLLDIPEPRWKHRPEWLAAISAFAGNGRPIVEEELTDFPRKCRDLMPALWLLLQRALLQGRVPASAFLLFRSRGLFVIADAADCTIYAASRTFNGLLPALTLAGEALLVLPRAGGAPLEELTGPGIPCVTDLPPGRGGSWRPASLDKGPKLWFSYPNVTPSALDACAAAIDNAEGAAENCARFIHSLSAAPLASDPEFEAWIGALAMAGVGAVEKFESPLAALESFEGFDALVQFRETRVRVRLPLGRRFLRLRDEGWLRPLERLPWMPRRVVEFSGG